MSAAGLPVCLTRPPKLVLHPPPVSKSEIQSIPGISHSCRKTTKKQAKKGKRSFSTWLLFLLPYLVPLSPPAAPSSGFPPRCHPVPLTLALPQVKLQRKY